MSKRNGKNKARLLKLDEINRIDRKMKRRKIREDEELRSSLLSKRNTLRQSLIIK
tara:strand:+ start:153 stop:317 length:165 start_codon:yes stop_codon:yes gene_type:complete